MVYTEKQQLTDIRELFPNNPIYRMNAKKGNTNGIRRMK
jgi:hypothetical protein